MELLGSDPKHHSLSARVPQGEGKVENLRGKEVTVGVESAWKLAAVGYRKGVFLMPLFSPPSH